MAVAALLALVLLTALLSAPAVHSLTVPNCTVKGEFFDHCCCFCLFFIMAAVVAKQLCFIQFYCPVLLLFKAMQKMEYFRGLPIQRYQFSFTLEIRASN